MKIINPRESYCKAEDCVGEVVMYYGQLFIVAEVPWEVYEDVEDDFYDDKVLLVSLTNGNTNVHGKDTSVTKVSCYLHIEE